jgi:hypothetical protein
VKGRFGERKVRKLEGWNCSKFKEFKVQRIQGSKGSMFKGSMFKGLKRVLNP